MKCREVASGITFEGTCIVRRGPCAGFPVVGLTSCYRALAAIGKYGSGYIDEWILHLTSVVVSFAVITLLFAMMFKWFPDTPVDWYDVWLGAILTTIFFEIGKLVIGFYIGKQGLESAYGAAASIIVVLIWVYYSSQIILMGAEVTHVFARHQGSIKARDQSAVQGDTKGRGER
jgi:membrane protein